MGKRRKAGNINPKKRLKKQGTAYYNREQEINYLLNNFTSAVYNPNFNLQNIKSYKQMNEIRMKLKRWKSETYITYLNVNFDVPKHLNPILSMKRS